MPISFMPSLPKDQSPTILKLIVNVHCSASGKVNIRFQANPHELPSLL